MNKSTVTISDVAKAAGVTRGTIDRVLHERGEVSEETRAKVLKVIKELGYKTNVYASMLAKNKSHDIAVILPKYKKGEFWELAHVGIEKAREYAGRFSVNVDECTYDQYSVDSFLSECRKVIKTGYSGIPDVPPCDTHDRGRDRRGEHSLYHIEYQRKRYIWPPGILRTAYI